MSTTPRVMMSQSASRQLQWNELGNSAWRNWRTLQEVGRIATRAAACVAYFTFSRINLNTIENRNDKKTTNSKSGIDCYCDRWLGKSTITRVEFGAVFNTKTCQTPPPECNTSSPKVIPNFNANCAVPSTSNFYNRQIADTYARLNEVFPNEATEEHRNQLWNIAETAYRLADEMYSIKEANIWADNFEISGNIVNSDEALFHASTRDLTTMVQTSKENFHRSDWISNV